MGRHQLAAPLVMVLLGAGCSLVATNETSATGGSQTSSVSVAPASPPSQTSSVPTTAQLSSRPVVCGDPGLVSPAAFDEVSGTYPAFVLSYVDDSPEFDVVQWLTGPEADALWDERFPDSEGPPNDYLIENQNALRRTAAVAPDASVALLVSEGGPTLVARSPGDFQLYVETGDYLGPPLVWLTFDNGTIVSICEQYRP